MPNLPNFRRQAMGDVVPAMLEPGEFVINRNAVNALGVDNLEVLNDAGGAHSAIDELIASATLADAIGKSRPPHYQEGGEVPSSWGQRFVERFPSRHEDPERAAGQERGLSGLIDFFVPQSAAEAGLMLAAGPVIGKGGKLISKGVQKISPSLKKYLRAKQPSASLSSEEIARRRSRLAAEEAPAAKPTWEEKKRLYGEQKRLEQELGAYEHGYIPEEGLSGVGVDDFMNEAFESGMDLSEALLARRQKFGYQEGGEVHGNRVGGPAGYPIPDLSEFTMNRYADVPGLEEFTMNRFVESLASKGERGLQDYYQGINAAEARGEFAPSIQGRGGREFSVVPETPQRNWQISGPEYPGEWQVSGPGYQEGGQVGMGLENFISRIAGEREDVTRAGIRDIMNRVAFHESAGTGRTDLAQYGGGPGRGV